MIYADFEYYINMYGGTALNNEAFSNLAKRASAYVDYITMGKAANMPDNENIKMAVCALSEIYQVIENAHSSVMDGKEISSQSVGSWSATYRSGADISEEYEKKLRLVANKYLMSTGLLYRGGGCCACTCRIP